MSSHLWHQLQQIQDPVRLTLVGQTVSVADLAANNPAISLGVGAGGDFLITNQSGVTLFNLNASNGMWWGRVGSYAVTGGGGRRFPGSYWETRIDLISGGFSQIPITSGSFVRISDLPNYTYRCNAVAGVTETGTARIQWRRFGTTTTLGQADFPLTIRTESVTNFNVTVEDVGIFGYGYGDTLGGSLSPTTFRGQTVAAILSPSISGGDVGIEIRGAAIPQNFFTQLDIQTKTGSIVSLLSANASFIQTGSPTSSWRWTSAGEVWDATTVGLVRTVTLRYF